MCHINFNNLVNIYSSSVVRDLLRLANDNKIYKECEVGKKTKGSYKGKEHLSTLDLVNADLHILTKTRSIQGEKYFMLLINDYSRMSWVVFLGEKLEVLEKFKIFNDKVENEVERRIKCLRSDRGGEFTSDEFNNYCEKHGIRRQLSVPRTPQQNGVVERMN